MPSIFTEYKSLIDTFLLQFLETKSKQLAAVNTFGPDAIARVLEVISRGKTVRGSLVAFAYQLSGKKIDEDTIRAGAAMELIHMAFLIHDDIMDRDTMRRGIPAMHVQFNSEAIAICIGDELLFLAFELLGSLKTNVLTLGRIIRLVSRESEAVCIAQMADVAGIAKTKLDIFSLYTYKTARYTFALPLMLGVTLAGTTKEMLRYLESYGVAVGILFQIRDDELDHTVHPFTKKDIDGFRHAAEASIQKLPIGEQNKKTLYDILKFTIERSA